MARRGDGIYQRGKTWWLDFMHEGRRHHARLGKGINRTVAGELASVKRAAIMKGEAGIGGQKRKDVLFDKAADTDMEWAEANKRPRTIRTYRQCIERLRRAFADKRLSELSPFDLERYKKGRVDGGARVVVNRELACLRALYNRCAEWGLYEGKNPADAVKALRESPGRIRYLEPDEEMRLLTAAKEPLRSMILVGIYAGVRLGSEGLTLRWADVNLARGLVTVQGAYAKSGRPRTIPLNAALRATFASSVRTPGTARSGSSRAGTGNRTSRSARPSRAPADALSSPTSRPTCCAIPSPRALPWPASTSGPFRSWAAGPRSAWCSATRT